MDRTLMRERGDLIVRHALSDARRTANNHRLHGWRENEFVSGVFVGRVIVADAYLGADRLQVMAANNELRFLARYTEART